MGCGSLSSSKLWHHEVRNQLVASSHRLLPTIKLFLFVAEMPSDFGLAKFRMGTGKALAAANELDDPSCAEGLKAQGFYFLLGTNPRYGNPQAYSVKLKVGSEDRLKQPTRPRLWEFLELSRCLCQ